MNKSKLVAGILLGVIIVDQLLKIWVKTHFYLGQEMPLLGSDKFLLHFAENAGMAFGMQFGGGYGKLLLSMFRLFAIVLMGFYLKELLRKAEVRRRLLLGLSLVLAGAIGNSIDSTLYGVLFTESSYGGEVAQFWAPQGGYAPFFYGRVVDMFFFPITYGNYPSWLPLVGGDSYLFFTAIFNIADVAICTGVILLIWDQFRSKKERKIDTKKTPPNVVVESD